MAGMFETQSYACRTLPRAKPAKYTIVDIDLTESSHLTDLRLWLMHKPMGGRVIFAVGPERVNDFGTPGVISLVSKRV